MALSYHPKHGEILKCDFSGFIAPEMTKARQVICISPKYVERGRICTIIPLSTTPPNPVEKYHHKLETVLPQLEGREDVEVWAKCDMLMAASFARLTPWWIEKKQGGKRVYTQVIVSNDDLLAIKKCVLHSLGLGGLTEYL